MKVIWNALFDVQMSLYCQKYMELKKFFFSIPKCPVNSEFTVLPLSVMIDRSHKPSKHR